MKNIGNLKLLSLFLLLLVIASSFISSLPFDTSNVLKKPNSNYIVSEQKYLNPITGMAVSERELTSKEIYSENKDAIVKILVYYDATFYAPDYNPVYDPYEYKVEPIIGSDNILGQVAWDTEDFSVNDVNQEAWYGSGVVISSDGYILTNAHVANNNIEEFEEQFKEEILYGLALGIGENNDFGYYTEEEYEMMQYYYANMEDNLKIDVSKISIKVVIGVEGTSDGAKIYTPEIIKREGGRGWDTDLIDYALLKIDANNLNYVEIGNSAEVSVGEQIYILGYPSITEDWGMDETYEFKTDITPTIGSGLISNIRDAGIYKIFQLDISLSGGNSGGAILDNQGKLIGIATYGSQGFEGGLYNYAIRINDILQNIPSSIILPKEQTKIIEPSEKPSQQIIPSYMWIIIVLLIVIVGLIIFIALRRPAEIKRKKFK